MLDPLHSTALYSFDVGEVYSMDGRAHPFDAHTPVIMDETQPRNVVVPDNATVSAGIPFTPVSMSLPIPGLTIPHFTARLVVGLVAVAVLIIAIIRLTFD